MKTVISLLIFMLLLSSCDNQPKEKNNLELGRLTINKVKPRPGDTLKITYTETALDSLEAYFYYMVYTQAYPVDIHFKKGENPTANVYIPDSASAIAFNFKKGDTFDTNNNEGYIVPLYNEEGKVLPGSKASMGAYSLYKGSDFGLEVDKDSILTTITNDIKKHPEVKEKWNSTYITLMYNHNHTKGKQLISDYIKSLNSKESLTEKEYESIINMYNLSHEKKKEDSIKLIAIEKFPNGESAKKKYLDSIFKTKDFDKKVKVFEAYTEKFPEASGWGKNWALQTMALTSYENGDKDKFKEYASQIDTKLDKAGVYNNIAWKNAEKGEDLDFAGGLSKSSLELIQSLENDPSSKPKFISANQYKKRLEGSYQMYADTYALILFKQGKTKESIKYQKVALGDGNSVDVNKRYIEFLMADKQYETALNKAEHFIEEGKAKPEVFEYYKTAYINVNGQEGLENKIAELKETAHEKLKEEIKNGLLSDEAPQFTLKDIDHNEVSLSSLKGKIVILDFWATWCGPCKASFPEMQKLVTKYKNNDGVAVLFVNTYENTPKREKDVASFISENKYDFHVLLDDPIKNSREFQVAKDYEVRGIPTKIIIGPDGKINYRSVGYMGDGKLMEEIDILIDLLKSKEV